MNWFKKKRIFMDYASATPVLSEAKKAMEKYWSEDFYNPSAIYEEGVRMKKVLDGWKIRVAALTGARADGVIFTSGGTASNVLAVRGVKPGKIVVEKDAHPSVTEAVVESNSKETTLVSSTTTDNRLGRKIREERKKNNSKYPLLHVDASQTAAYFNIGLEVQACDLITLDGAKLYGPKGVGALIVRNGADIKLPPLGTPAVVLIAGFVKALEIAARDREAEFKRLELLSAAFVETLKNALPQSEILCQPPNIINVSVPGILPELMVLALDRKGVLVSAGPACTSNKPEPPETPVRFSFGRFTTEEDAKKAAETFCSTVQNMLKSLHKVEINSQKAK